MKRMNVLWLLFLPLTIWGMHFLTAYGVAAVYCAKSSNVAAAIVAIRWIVVVATLLALTAIGACVWYGRRRFASDRPAASASGARGQARFAWTVLLSTSALGALAVISVSGAAFFFGDCR